MNLLKIIILILLMLFSTYSCFHAYKVRQEWLAMEPFYDKADSIHIEQQKVGIEIKYIKELLATNAIPKDSALIEISKKDIQYNKLGKQWEYFLLKTDSLDRTNRYLK